MAVIHNQRCHIQLVESVPTQPGESRATIQAHSQARTLDVSHLSSGAYIYKKTARMGNEAHSASEPMTLIKQNQISA